MELRNQYGFINYHISAPIVTVQYLHIDPQYRGRGYAVDLLTKVIDIGMKHKCTFIELDDASDNYRSEHNIYVKLGILYTDQEAGETMRARLSRVRTNVRIRTNVKL